MRRTLLVTNDFPPRAGGIQSYVQALAERLPAQDLVVYAPSWPGAAEFDAFLVEALRRCARWYDAMSTNAARSRVRGYDIARKAAGRAMADVRSELGNLASLGYGRLD